MGPESDIALDHISLIEGDCEGNSRFNPLIFTRPSIDEKYYGINALKVGPSFTPFPDFEGPSAAPDPCLPIKTCSECVSSHLRDCLWCADSQKCLTQSSSDARKCALNTAIWNSKA